MLKAILFMALLSSFYCSAMQVNELRKENLHLKIQHVQDLSKIAQLQTLLMQSHETERLIHDFWIMQYTQSMRTQEIKYNQLQRDFAAYKMRKKNHYNHFSITYKDKNSNATGNDLL